MSHDINEPELSASSIPVWVTAAGLVRNKCSLAFEYASRLARMIQKNILGNNRNPKTLHEYDNVLCQIGLMMGRKFQSDLNEFTARTQSEPELTAA